MFAWQAGPPVTMAIVDVDVDLFGVGEAFVSHAVKVRMLQQLLARKTLAWVHTKTSLTTTLTQSVFR